MTSAAKEALSVSPQEQPRDRPFNPWRYAKADSMKAIVADISRQLQNYERFLVLRKRRRRPRDQDTFEQTVEAIVCDLVHHHLQREPGGIYVSRSRQLLGRRSRYRAVALSSKLPAILDHLSSPEMGFVKQRVGQESYFGNSKRTVIHPGPRLITRIEDNDIDLEDIGIADGQEVIVLKRLKGDHWDKGGTEDYDDTETTQRFREQMHKINAWLLEAEVDYDSSDGNDGTDVSDRHLRRVFTRGRFDSGGRLFGGFWLPLSKRERLRGLSISCRGVYSLDYSQLGVRIAYGLVRATPKLRDCYVFPELHRHREGVKKLMNALLFSEKELKRMPKGIRQLFPDRMSVTEAVDLIRKYHSAIESLFYTGIGHHIQFIESQIMVDVLLRLIDEGVTALPVHDAVIVTTENEAAAREAMNESFRAHTGLPGLIKREVSKEL